MKAIIKTLWETGIDIVTTASDCNEIKDISCLRKCDNVLVGDYVKEMKAWEVLIDDSIFMIHFRTVTHPTGFGKLIICEICW